MSSAAVKSETRVSLAEYLRREETAEQKHEFHDGEVLATEADNYDHAIISVNLTATVGIKLGRQACYVLNSNMRVATAESRRFVYPDASVLCQEPQFHPEDRKQTTIINPRVVFEVLSESTEGYDRGEKFNHYRRIATLEEYILVAQDRPLVESFLRQGDGTWSMMTWEASEAVATVRCLPLELPLAELYKGITFDAKPAAGRPTAEQPL